MQSIPSALKCNRYFGKSQSSIGKNRFAMEVYADKERHQLFSYMVGTQFPIGILVNFATYDRAQIERYFLDRQDGTFMTF